VKLKIKDGKVICVYTDAINLHALGVLDVHRASSVEFDSTSQRWTAVLTDGTLVGSFSSRQAAIKAEVEMLEIIIFK
jgi:hypothetical protein